MSRWPIILASLLALAAGFLVATRDATLPWSKPGRPDIQGFFWPEQKALQPFEMVSHNNQPFDLGDLQGRWTILFFGYTFCPDICPVTMSVLRESMAQYREMAPAELADLDVAFISVDGERDTPAQLAGYIRFYDESWMAASGSREQVDSLAGQLGVPYEIDDHEPGDANYLVSHSGTLFLISPDGTLASLFSPPFDPAQLAAQVLEIRRFMQAG